MTVPMALIVDGTEELIAQMSEAALAAQVLVAECTVRDAATLAAEMRPLVLAMTQKVYNQDPESFEALARDVRAALLVVPADDKKRLDLQSLLEAKMHEAEKHRPSWSV